MKQLVVLSEKIKNGVIKLYDEDFHYLIHVRRHKIGDRIEIIDEKSNKLNSQLTVISKDSCCLTILEKFSGENQVELNLIQCLPKAKKMDKIIREVTEAGITKVFPVISEYSISRPDEENFTTKVNRWNKIAQEAVQQSGSNVVTKVEDIFKLSLLLDKIDDNSIKIFFHQIKTEKNITLHKTLEENLKKIYYIIGPEGGLSDKEVELLISKGFTPIHLGNNILRTETAGIYAAGAIKIILLENVDD